MQTNATLKALKAGPMKIVKGDKALKSMWSAGRRAITPKVGQLTNDSSAIMRIVSVLGFPLRYHDAMMIFYSHRKSSILCDQLSPTLHLFTSPFYHPSPRPSFYKLKPR